MLTENFNEKLIVLLKSHPEMLLFKPQVLVTRQREIEYDTY